MVMTLGAAFTVMASACVAIALFASVSEMVKLEATAAVGVPVIDPVDEFKLRPGGILPAVTFQVRGAVPPEPASVCEYVAAMVVAGNDEVVIERAEFTIQENE